MARQLHLNARNYREPFMLIKIVEKLEDGLVVSKSYHSKLIYASIIKKDLSTVESALRDDKERLSIRFLNTDWEITTRDLIYRNEKVFSVVSTNRDLFNKQEQEITCEFLENIQENKDLFNYVNLANQDSAVEKALNENFVRTSTFTKTVEDIDANLKTRQTTLPDNDSPMLIRVENGVISYSTVAKQISDAEREKWNEVDGKLNKLTFDRHAADTAIALSLKQDSLDDAQIANLNLNHALYETVANVAEFKTELKTLINSSASNLEIGLKKFISVQLEQKANVSGTYSKDDLNSKLSAKSDISDVYSKTDLNSMFELKADKTQLPDLDAINEKINEKANISNVYSKTDLNSLLELKANLDFVSRELATIKSKLTKRWQIPSIATLAITRARKHGSNFIYDITLNHFDSKEKVIWFLQYLKLQTPDEREKWAIKFSDLFDAAKESGHNYTQFWKIVLFENPSDPDNSSVSPFLGGFSPVENNSGSPKSSQVMTSSWKFHDKNAVKLALLYLVNKYSWSLTVDNAFYTFVESAS